MSRLPNFFIAGAARSGTTSMWRYLQQHPDIFMADDGKWKEPSYYCSARRQFGIESREAYLNLFSGVRTEAMVGEASGPYLTSPESPGLIHREIPDARFVIMLRNPADRAYSLYKWMHYHGFESESTITRALIAEDRSRYRHAAFQHDSGQYYYNFLYFRSGLYCEQVKRFVDTFGRERVRVVLFEDFAHAPLGVVQGIYAFLGVNSTFCPQLAVHNASSPNYPSLDPQLRRSLLDAYRSNITRLSDLLERDLLGIWA